MDRDRIAPPNPDEYSPFYAPYIVLAREHDPADLLAQQVPALNAMLGGMSDDEALHRYAPEKWSIKQVLGHLSDTERTFSYRLFRVSRGDTTPLAGFDQNAYVQAAGFDGRPLHELLGEFGDVRAGTLRLVEGIPANAWTRRGIANDSPVSARGLLFALVGHVEHHFGVLRERYGVGI